ncbi:MAG: thiol peroxidase [Woeseia sp.]|nr:thiol peroxidase [Woeseia sp.]MBT8097279.1 thiol peroxidase [Woeseia sp.]NNE59346.1 thiol peroxidase [Woeseia sp.]NNL54422.1 thiol peroxidase [Woeseia sp.]
MPKVNYLGTRYAIYGELPTIGSRGADVSLVNTDLRDMTLANWTGKRKILNIFPSIDTPICAKSVIAFDKLSEGHDDLAMLMISYDLPFAHLRFREEHKLERVVQLSAIRHAGFGENYGVLITEGPLAGMFARAIVVLDENDTVVHEQLVDDIWNEPDYEAALAALGIKADIDLVCD